MNTLLTPLLARLTSATGVTFTVNTAGDIVVPAGDAFKLAALVDFAGRCADIIMCFPDSLRETIALGSEVFPAQPKVTSVGVQPDFTGRAALDMEQEKLAEAGRKSWVTRRANAAKLDARAAAHRAPLPSKKGRLK